jgi:hypothetical protein
MAYSANFHILIVFKDGMEIECNKNKNNKNNKVANVNKRTKDYCTFIHIM